MGNFAWTLNIVDHKTSWTEQEAFLVNSAAHVVDATISIRSRLPFKIVSFHTDGGSKFINNLLFQYLQNPKDSVTQTHGRAYKKNDQARVEQRNWTHVRQIFGYERISSQELVNLNPFALKLELDKKLKLFEQILKQQNTITDSSIKEAA